MKHHFVKTAFKGTTKALEGAMNRYPQTTYLVIFEFVAYRGSLSRNSARNDAASVPAGSRILFHSSAVTEGK